MMIPTRINEIKKARRGQHEESKGQENILP